MGYVDNLTFISSSGLLLGPAQPVNGYGGGFFNTLKSLDSRFNCFNTSLKGFECYEVLSQNKLVFITRLTFKYKIVGDATYKQPENHGYEDYDEHDEYDHSPDEQDYEQDYDDEYDYEY